jgi:hypothetical protein
VNPMFEDKGSNRTSPPRQNDELTALTLIPVAVLRRTLTHDLDSPSPLLLSVEDSQIAIAQAIREAMEDQRVTIYHLHEMTGLSCDFIEAMVNEEGDLSDSEPLSKIQEALGIRLTHL